MALLDRLFRRSDAPKEALRPLYAAVVARARAPHWYLAGGVPDTLDGRFDMVALVISQLLLRIEDSDAHKREAVLLTEIFVDDMDGQMRQIGFGDIVVGKQIGRIMSALGGRLGAYRDAGDDRAALEAALVRNIWNGEPPGAAALAHVADEALHLRAELAAINVAALVAADALPGPTAA
jgi:cytochrome b pre-mRNA-processing protein 3